LGEEIIETVKQNCCFFFAHTSSTTKMLRVLQLLVLLLVSVLVKGTITPGNASPFAFFTRGDRTSIGTYFVEVTATPAGPIVESKPSNTVKFCESASAQTLVFETEDEGTQWVTPNGYFYQWLDDPSGPVACAANLNFNITKYQQHYAQVVQVFEYEHEGKTIVGYEGAVVDPGQPATFSAAFILLVDGEFIEYVLAGSVYVPGEFPVKTSQKLFFTSTHSGLHNCPPLPAACSNPTSYNEKYSPVLNAEGLPIQYTIPFNPTD
jgi:hypothetical protein